MTAATTIVHEVEYSHSVERVWRALTDAGELSEWLMPTDFEPRLGARFTLRMGERDNEVFHCEVTAIDEPNSLSYTWSGGGLEMTTVVWTLTAIPGGTHLKLEHSGFDLDDGMEAAIHGQLNAGWRSDKLGRALPELLDRVA